MINEQDAIRRCQSGDREAFRPIVEYYGDVLMGTLYLMTHDRAVSEELVQETFVRARETLVGPHRGQPGAQREGSPSAVGRTVRYPRLIKAARTQRSAMWTTRTRFGERSASCPTVTSE